jgi:hypothetical protein
VPSESVRGKGANLEIIVEGQLGRVTRAYDMRLSQPQPVFDVLDPQENVPAIGGLPDFPGWHLSQAEHIAAGCGQYSEQSE